ncbi:aminotransferase class IV [Kitasatospora sp. NPDC059571]|uniref:aminotransferase class IV n=1 Tax=Kitasatospora sp. NPDC059571 TaxID=3346871 RepID=UPI0036895591
MAELDGRPAEPAQLQALALTNYGHFTTMRVEDGLVRGLALHLDRLARDCRVLFGAELDPERVRAYARRAAPASGAAVIRVTVYDPALDVGTIGAPAHPRVLVTVRPAGPAVLGPLRVRTVRYERDLPEVKGVGLYGALHHRRQAQAAGFDDALFTDRTGAISEGGTWNAGFVRDGAVLWPQAAHLPGTTMRLLQSLGPWRGAEVRSAEGMAAGFATNAAIGVRPLAAVDGVALPPVHPVVEALRTAYAALPGDPL